MRIKDNNKVEVNKKMNPIFSIAYFLFIFSTIVLETSEIRFWNKIPKVVRGLDLIIIFLLIIKILFYTKNTRKEIVEYFFCGIVFFLSFYNTGSLILFKGILFVIAAKDVNFRQFVKYDLKLRFIFVSIIILFTISGIINNYTLIRTDTYQIRYSLGFTHPNTLAAFIMIICFEWIYIRYYKIKYYDYLAVLIIMGIINKITDSRTSMLITILLILLAIGLKRKSKLLIVNFMTIYIIPVCSIISMFICNNYNAYNKIMFQINDIFSSRIEQGKIFIDNYGFSLFGQRVSLISLRTALAENIIPAILDNAYIHLGVIYGIFPLIIFNLAYIKLTKKLIKVENYSLIIFIIAFALYGFMETYIFNIQYNFTILAILNLSIYNNININKKNKIQE